MESAADKVQEILKEFTGRRKREKRRVGTAWGENLQTVNERQKKWKRNDKEMKKNGETGVGWKFSLYLKPLTTDITGSIYTLEIFTGKCGEKIGRQMSFFRQTGQPLEGRGAPPGRADGLAVMGVEGSFPAPVILLVAADEREEVVVALWFFGAQREGEFVTRRLADDRVPQLERPHGMGVEFIRPENDHASHRCRVQLGHDPMALASRRH